MSSYYIRKGHPDLRNNYGYPGHGDIALVSEDHYNASCYNARRMGADDYKAQVMALLKNRLEYFADKPTSTALYAIQELMANLP